MFAKLLFNQPSRINDKRNCDLQLIGFNLKFSCFHLKLEVNAMAVQQFLSFCSYFYCLKMHMTIRMKVLSSLYDVIEIWYFLCSRP